MKTSRIWIEKSRAIVALVASMLFVFAFFARAAYAEEGYATYASGNGWELSYSVSDGGAITIEKLTATGTGKLVVPAQIEGHDVVAFAPKSFYNEGGNAPSASLKEIEIPTTVTTLGAYAFMGSGLESISIPAGVQEIPTGCFGGCTDLREIYFEGESMGYFGEAAFSGCTSLVRIDVPELTKTVGNETYRIGKKCFYRCSSLETIVFHGRANTYKADSSDHPGAMGSSTPTGYYVANIDCFGYCSNIKNVVYYTKRDRITNGTGTTSFGNDNFFKDAAVYHTLAFYGNEDDSKNCINPLYTISCRSSCEIMDILNGTVEPDDVWAEWGERPVLPDDMTWGVQENALSYSNSKLTNTYNVIPVSKYDLTYGWVSSQDIDGFYNGEPTAVGKYEPNVSGGQTIPRYYVDNENIVYGLDGFELHLPTGELADPETYKITYQKKVEKEVDGKTETTYEEVERPDSAGTYHVGATGTGGTINNSKTSWGREITVIVFSPSVNTCSDQETIVRLGRSSQVVASAVKSTAICDVVVPVSDWRYQLIGAGLAGVGKGALIFDDGPEYSSRAVTAVSESKVSALQVVGSTNIVPESASPSAETYLMDFLNERSITYKTRYSNDDTIQQLADQVYSTIRRLQDTGNDVYGEGWGATAIVASPDCCIDALPIAQLAYTQMAPVFFVGEDGQLSTTELGYLKNDGFEKVIIAGDATYVSDECATAIQLACGFAPTRVLDAGDNSLDACLDFVANNDFGTSTIAIAAGNDPANSTAAAVIAASQNGIMLPCSSTSDSKHIQEYLRAIIAEKGQPSIAKVYLVGDFSNVDAGLKDRISQMWANPQPTAVEPGDSFEIGDYVYKLEPDSKAQCQFVRNPDLTEAVVADIVYNGVTYTAENPAAGAFVGARKIESVKYESPSVTSLTAGIFTGSFVKTVDLGSKVKTIGSNAFKNCTSITSVNCPAVTSVAARAFAGCSSLAHLDLPAATSIGISAFEGCTSLGSLSAGKATSLGKAACSGCTELTSVSLPKATSIGASAFAGCTSLKTVSAAKAKTIGASAFSGCKALSSFKSTKATTIGASAFEGCKRLTTATFTSAGLKKIGAKAFKSCSKLRKLTLNTVKLNAKKVGANAFRGVTKRVKVFVPKAKIKAYKKLFAKKGLPKGAHIVKAK